MRLKEVNLESRKDLLPAIMKSPGPFMQFSDGSMYRDSASLDSQTYIEALRGVTILEASGRVDIPLLQRELEQWARDS
jgi:hypothetical protein